MPSDAIEIEAGTGLLFRVGDASTRVFEVNDVGWIGIDRPDMADRILRPIFPPSFPGLCPFVPARIAWFPRQRRPEKFLFEGTIRDVRRTEGIIQDVARKAGL